MSADEIVWADPPRGSTTPDGRGQRQAFVAALRETAQHVALANALQVPLTAISQPLPEQVA